MGTLIDTSVLIAAERRQLDLEATLGQRADELFFLAAISASELLHGVHRAQTAAQRTQREAFVEAVLAQLPVVPFDLLAARIHGRLSAELRAQGLILGAHDLIIGATALANGWRVATRDERSFPKVPGLAVQIW